MKDLFREFCHPTTYGFLRIVPGVRNKQNEDPRGHIFEDQVRRENKGNLSRTNTETKLSRPNDGTARPLVCTVLLSL